jgi:primosomal protein N' (replication factor Y)
MVFHNVVNSRLICHHCGQKQKPPTLCPSCAGHRIKFIGTGTQKVEQELLRFCENSAIAPNQCRVARLDTDIAPKWILQKKIFDDFREQKYNILIGTQLMLKTEILPKVALAAIITIDPPLSIPDFRMSEQILRTVDRLKNITLSKVMLQTYIPENYIIKYVLSDLLATNIVYTSVLNKILAGEIENRRALSFPPFSQLIKLVYRHTDSQKAEQEAQILKNKLQTQIANLALPAADFALLGPAPAFIPRVKNRYIWQIMIKSKITDFAMRNKILRIVPYDWKIDVDPVEML